MESDRPGRWRAEVPVATWGAERPRPRAWDRLDAPMPRPVFRPGPRSAMVFPLVVLVAVLPGLVALKAWDLTPPGPLWGLRGLAVVDGLVLDQVPAADAIRPIGEKAAYQTVAFQPPLYAWLEAILFWLDASRDPMASVLPSYIAGALAVTLVYLHGRLWRGAGLGLTAAILVGFNQNLLLRMQEATPATLALCGVLAVLLAYGWHERLSGEALRPPVWVGPVATTVAGGLAMGLALLSLGGLALIVVPIMLLHRYYLRASQSASQAARGRSWPSRFWSRLIGRGEPGRLHVLAAAAIAVVVALPWFVLMVQWHGWQAVAALGVPPERLLADSGRSLPGRLIELAPVSLPLGLYGAVRAIRAALVDETESRESVGGAFWVIWLVVAALAPAAWPRGPQSAFDLVLLVPLNLLAAQTIADLVNRRIPVRSLTWLAPATAISAVWWSSGDLRGAVDDVVHGRADAATALGLHLALDLVVVSAVLIRAVDRWARRDDRQRRILAAFLVIVLAVSAFDGLKEVVFRHRIDGELLDLRTMIRRRDRDTPFQVVAVLSPPGVVPASLLAGGGSSPHGARVFREEPSPGGRLRFILRTALPHLPQRDLTDVSQLFDLPDGQRLVILAGNAQPLAGGDRFRLGLEAIHPGRSGILDAYATIRQRTRSASARPSGP